MCVSLNRWACLMLTIILWVAATVEARPLLMAVCNDPTGSEMRYGSSLWELDGEAVETSSTEYAETQLVFLIKPEQPKTLVVKWRQPPTVSDRAEGRVEHYHANLILHTASQLTAIHQHGQAVWMYSLFPKLAIAYISSHSHFPLGYDSRSTSTYAICQITGEKR